MYPTTLPPPPPLQENVVSASDTSLNMLFIEGDTHHYQVDYTTLVKNSEPKVTTQYYSFVTLSTDPESATIAYKVGDPGQAQQEGVFTTNSLGEICDYPSPFDQNTIETIFFPRPQTIREAEVGWEETTHYRGKPGTFRLLPSGTFEGEHPRFYVPIHHPPRSYRYHPYKCVFGGTSTIYLGPDGWLDYSIRKVPKTRYLYSIRRLHQPFLPPQEIWYTFLEGETHQYLVTIEKQTQITIKKREGLRVVGEEKKQHKNFEEWVFTFHLQCVEDDVATIHYTAIADHDKQLSGTFSMHARGIVHDLETDTPEKQSFIFEHIHTLIFLRPRIANERFKGWQQEPPNLVIRVERFPGDPLAGYEYIPPTRESIENHFPRYEPRHFSIENDRSETITTSGGANSTERGSITLREDRWPAEIERRYTTRRDDLSFEGEHKSDVVVKYSHVGDS